MMSYDENDVDYETPYVDFKDGKRRRPHFILSSCREWLTDAGDADVGWGEHHVQRHPGQWSGTLHTISAIIVIIIMIKIIIGHSIKS